MGCLFRFTFLSSFVSVLASGFFLSLVSLFRISLFTDPFILVFNYIIRGLCFFMIIIPGIQALAAVLAELRRIENGAGVDEELLDLIYMIADILNGMKEETE